MGTSPEGSLAGGLVKAATGASIAWAILFIILGLIALALPYLAGIGIAIFFTWLILIGGVAHLIYAFSSKRPGVLIWHLLIGVVYLVGGIYLLMHPNIGLLSLTLVLAVVFLVEGVLDIVAFFRARSNPGAGWLLFDGIVTLLLGFLIWFHWPSSAVWAIGTLAGINLLISGISRLSVAWSLRRLAKAT